MQNRLPELAAEMQKFFAEFADTGVLLGADECELLRDVFAEMAGQLAANTRADQSTSPNVIVWPIVRRSIPSACGDAS